MADADVFEQARPRLLGLAYRMLGTVSDAEDIVQEAWLRWERSTATPERPEAWLTTVTTRLALDQLRSAQRRRELYVGPWLPEPVTTDPAPEQIAIMSESLTLGFLTVLDALSPVERAVFLLADVFAVAYADIAVTVDRSEVACRQIASRARRRLRDARPYAQSGQRPLSGSGAQWQLVETFTVALAAGDIRSALSCLAPDAVLVSDGGAGRHAARRPVLGAGRIVRLLANLSKRGLSAGYAIAPAVINRTPGLVFSLDGTADLVAAFEITGGQLQRIWLINNPDKLTHLDVAVPFS